MIKKFAVFDIDGTLIRWQLYHAIADTLVRLGYSDAQAFGVVKDARMRWKTRTHQNSFKEYERVLINNVDKTLLKLTYAQYLHAIDEVFGEYKDQVYTYTRGLIANLKKKGYFLLAISGSQEEIIAKVAKHYGFDDFVGSVYELKDGSFTGKKIVPSSSKKEVLDKLVKKHGLSYKDSVAVGDTLSDIPMLEAVETAIAFNPDLILFEHAKTKGWQIVIERKNVVYKLSRETGGYKLVA